MTRAAEESQLAARLRQAVQGCTLHPNGPVQSWSAVLAAGKAGRVDPVEVVRQAIRSCLGRADELRAAGVAEDDPRVRKELVASSFLTTMATGLR